MAGMGLTPVSALSHFSLRSPISDNPASLPQLESLALCFFTHPGVSALLSLLPAVFYMGSLGFLRLPAGHSLAFSLPPPPCFLSSPSSSSLPFPSPTTLSPLPCSHSEPPPGLTFLEASSFMALFSFLDAPRPRGAASVLWAVAAAQGVYLSTQPRAGGLPCREAWSRPSPHAWPTLQPLIHCRRMWDSLPAQSCTVGFAPLSQG